MKSPEDIKKGLRHCSEDGCKHCPYEDDCHLSDGGSELAADALAYIVQLERKLRAVEDIHIGKIAERINSEKLKAIDAEKAQLEHERITHWEKVMKLYEAKESIKYLARTMDELDNGMEDDLK